MRMKRPTGRFPPERKRPLEQEWPFHLDGARGRNRTGTTVKSRDFKSLVSTSFTTRAEPNPQKIGFVEPDPVFIHPWMMKSPVDLGSTGLSIVEAEVGIEPAYTDLQSASKIQLNHCLTIKSFPQALGILQPESQRWRRMGKTMRKRFHPSFQRSPSRLLHLKSHRPVSVRDCILALPSDQNHTRE